MLATCRLRPSRVSRGKNPALMTGEPAGEPGALGHDRRGERDRPGRDVRVLSLLVRCPVVLVVLGAPPREAQAGERSGEDARRPLVGRRRAKDLPVRGVVAEEPELGHDEPEHRGDEQLPPRVADEHERHAGPGERRHRQPDVPGVGEVATSQQAGVAHLPQQLGVQADVSILGTGCGGGGGHASTLGTPVARDDGVRTRVRGGRGPTPALGLPDDVPARSESGGVRIRRRTVTGWIRSNSKSGSSAASRSQWAVTSFRKRSGV